MNFSKIPLSHLLFCLGFIFIISACNNEYIDDIKRGSGYNYIPGYPELRLEVAGIINLEGEPKLQVAGSIPHNSLIFKNRDDSLKATISIAVQIKNKSTDEVETFSYQSVVSKNSESSVFDDQLFLLEWEYEVKPGDYEVNVTVTDLSSRNTILRSAEAFLPNTSNKVSNITNIRILAKHDENNGQFFPVTTYDVRNASDSVKFVFQVNNKDPERQLTFQARLIKYNSDTTIARPMAFTNPSRSSVEFKGIEYDEFEVIQSTRRELNQPGNVNIEFAFEDLQRGNYRFEVAPDLEARGPLYKARDFSIKSKNYPSVKTPRELARPLAYLMNEKEYQQLMRVQDNDSLKNAIDRFWLKNIQNSRQAKNVISLYYQRVEEANKLFSNYKEGWKTDLGMIYILFGPPLDQYKTIRGIRWSYKYNQNDPEYTYYFSNIKTNTPYYPFDNYRLERDKRYFNIEYRIRELWLSGNIINRNI